MKTTRCTILFLLLASSFLMSLNVKPAWGEPNPINVPDGYLTIQEAIDAAESGDSIFVSSGTYEENLVVNKTISLIGENADTTIIDGGKVGYVVNVTMHGVNLSGFTVRNGGAGSGGVYMHVTNNTSVSGNIIVDNEYGVFFQNSASNYIGANIFVNNFYGVFMVGSNENVIDGNIITNSDPTGIYLERSSNINIIRGNTITNSTDSGIQLSSSDTNDINGNVISENDNDGLVLVSSLWSRIYQNTISSNIYGIFSMKSNGSVIYRNNIVSNIEQAFLQSSTGVMWDNGAEGNFWSDHETEDVDVDGIGDDPYLIGADNTDIYPLMEPWSPTRIYDVVHEGETFRVTMFSNSTVAGFDFSSFQGQISFRVTGPTGNLGLCNVTIPKGLLSGYTWLVLLDGTDVTAGTLIVENSTHTSLFFSFTFSTRTAKVINADMTVPRADAGFDQTVNEDTLVSLNGSGSWDDFGIASYTWTFIDVNLQSLSGEAVSYNFTNPGVYVVTLNVSDAGSNWATDTVSIMVLDVTPPVANAGQNQTVDVGTTVTFDAGDSEDNVGIISYFWDFGDNSTLNMTTPIATHVYTDPGNYTVTLTVQDGANNPDADWITVKVVVPEETFPPWNTILVLTAVVAVALIVTAFFFRYRKRRVDI